MVKFCTSNIYLYRLVHMPTDKANSLPSQDMFIILQEWIHFCVRLSKERFLQRNYNVLLCTSNIRY